MPARLLRNWQGNDVGNRVPDIGNAACLAMRRPFMANYPEQGRIIMAETKLIINFVSG